MSDKNIYEYKDPRIKAMMERMPLKQQPTEAVVLPENEIQKIEKGVKILETRNMLVEGLAVLGYRDGVDYSDLTISPHNQIKLLVQTDEFYNDCHKHLGLPDGENSVSQSVKSFLKAFTKMAAEKDANEKVSPQAEGSKSEQIKRITDTVRNLGGLQTEF